MRAAIHLILVLGLCAGCNEGPSFSLGCGAPEWGELDPPEPVEDDDDSADDEVGNDDDFADDDDSAFP